MQFRREFREKAERLEWKKMRLLKRMSWELRRAPIKTLKRSLLDEKEVTAKKVEGKPWPQDERLLEEDNNEDLEMEPFEDECEDVEHEEEANEGKWADDEYEESWDEKMYAELFEETV